ncbi:hypothetical protein OUZ56_000929 [Daphnia magna]|uniref:Uncharacterized protein n=1 Tax=Daphnia magna TaxID=35525 RepID=A0ABR0A159_9CRUS|nr:hypothetical protein OUZ56_000929 [Daphnia magna]
MERFGTFLFCHRTTMAHGGVVLLCRQSSPGRQTTSTGKLGLHEKDVVVVSATDDLGINGASILLLATVFVLAQSFSCGHGH